MRLVGRPRPRARCSVAAIRSSAIRRVAHYRHAARPWRTEARVDAISLPLENSIALRDRRPRKKEPMRIEMAIASA